MAEQASGTRVSDAERQQVVEVLTRAHGQGRLGLAEFDERAGRAYGAVVHADLAPLTADLPADPPAGGPGHRPVERVHRADPGLRAAVAVWAVVSAINLVIWVAVSLAVAGPVHPWWIWVAGPWGAMLALRAASGRGLPGPAGLPGPCALALARGRR